MWHGRCTFICIPCRFTSKYPGRCPGCSTDLASFYNFRPPRKRDDAGWEKLILSVLVSQSNIQLCTWSCCVPIRHPKNIEKLTLSQYKARIRKQRTHRQGGVPQWLRPL